MIKLLIADDEYWVRENIINMLDWNQYGIELCEPARDGEDALLKLADFRPHILLTDVNMPFISGVELIQKARAIYPELVVITLSGFSDYEYIRQALLAGSIDYLLKPLEREALDMIVRKAISLIETRLNYEKEQENIAKDLSLARLLIRDQEFSDFFADANVGSDVSELESRFEAYALFLIKLAKSPGARMDDALTNRIRIAIKQAAQPFEGIVVKNLYASNEFILLCNAEDRAGLCSNLLEAPAFSGGVSIGASRRYSSFTQLKKAYDEAVSALTARSFSNVNVFFLIEDTEYLRIQKWISVRQEKELAVFLKNRNITRLRRLIFNDIGVESCSDWRFIEVKQTINRVAWLIGQGISADRPGAYAFMMDDIAEMLNMALESLEPAEVCGILNWMIDEALGTGEDISAESAKQTVRKLRGYIDENYFERMSLGSLAQKYLIEPSYLSRIFKRETGENLIPYINRKRIEHAAEYIRDRKRHLSEISYLVGFDDYAYFNRVFRKTTGRSPSEYMKMARG